jgi:hypothetical protein
MTLPTLANWDATAHSLHRAAQLLSGVRLLLLERVPNWLELAMQIKANGLSTGTLPDGGEVTLNFRQAALIYRRKDGAETSIPLNGHTQASLFRALLKAMQAGDLANTLAGVPESELVDVTLKAMAATKHPLLEGHNRLTDETPFMVDAQLANDYWTALDAVFTGVARFRAHLLGHMTPVVVWGEHFDLSTLWFVDGAMDDHKAHINFGFSPFSPGFPRPYLYAYAYPYPANMTFPSLPTPARWNTEGWTGVVVDYDAIAAQDNSVGYVEDLCAGIFAALRPLLG